MKKWHHYRDLFPSVEYMTSRELQNALADPNKNSDGIVLIDVRTKAQEAMLSGAAQLLKEQHPSLDIVSLDGIEPFKHCSQASQKPLVHKNKSGEIISTNRVHAYGPPSKLANPEFD
eukprot:scaffold4715_cov115-Cylindrotheca_fusiformis.AAC.17